MPYNIIMIGIIVILFITIIILLSKLIPLIIYAFEYEGKDNSRYRIDNRDTSTKIMKHMKETYPDYFNEKYERLAVISLDGNDNIIDVYLKPKEKGDNKESVYVPWSIIREMANSSASIVTIHQHPRIKSGLRASYFDARVYSMLLEMCKRSIAIVTDRTMSQWVEYDDISNISYDPSEKRLEELTINYNNRNIIRRKK
jgi:hypothetical protein